MKPAEFVKTSILIGLAILSAMPMAGVLAHAHHFGASRHKKEDRREDWQQDRQKDRQQDHRKDRRANRGGLGR